MFVVERGPRIAHGRPMMSFRQTIRRRLFTSTVYGGLIALSLSVTAHAQDSADYTKAIYSKVLTFDPAMMTDTASLSVASQIYDGLLEFGPHFDIKPALAEQWETSRDGRVMTFHLRHGITFHDGSPITSEDCVRSFERLLSKNAIVSKYYDLVEGADDFKAGKAAHVRGLIAQDPQTFVIHLKNKFPPFPAVLAGATAKILPKNRVDQPGFFLHPVGAGPFRVVSFDEHAIKLERFPEYWRGPAKLEHLNFVVADEPDGIALAKSGKVQDLVTYPLNGDEQVFKSGQHLQIPVIATWIIGLNSRLKPFNRKEVREAFRAALSSEDFIRTFYPGQLTAYGYIPPGLPGYMKHVRERATPTKHLKISTPITILVPKELTKSEEIGRYFEKKYREAGFNVTADVTSWEELERRYNEKSSQAFLMSMNADYPDVEFLARNFESDNPDNFSGIHSNKIDRLTRQARQMDSRVERSAIYEKLSRAIDDEALTVNLLHYRAHYWFDACVNGIELNSLGDVYIPYRDISISESCGSTTLAEGHRP